MPSGSPMWGQAGRRSHDHVPKGPGPGLSTGSLGWASSASSTPANTTTLEAPAPRAQRVTIGAAGRRPRRTLGKRPSTPLTPPREHASTQSSRGSGLSLGPQVHTASMGTLQLGSVWFHPRFTDGEAEAVIQDQGAGSADSQPVSRTTFRARGSRQLKLQSLISPCPLPALK